MLSSSCEFDRHIEIPSSCYHHLVSSIDTSTCWHDAVIMLSSSCEFDRHIDMLSSCYHHLVSSTDTSTCSHHAIIILWFRQTYRHALTMISLRSTDTSSSRYHHIVSSTDTSTCSHHDIIILWVRQTHRHTHITWCCHHHVSSTDTSTCSHHDIIILWVRHWIYRHIDMLSPWYHWGRQTHLRHATIILWVRQTHRHHWLIVMLSSWGVVASTNTKACTTGTHALSHGWCDASNGTVQHETTKCAN